MTDNFLPLIKLGLLALATGLSLARVDMSSARWLSSKGMFSLKRIFFRFSLAPLTLQGFALIFPQQYSLTFFALLLAAPTAITGIIVCRSLGALVLPTAYAIVMTTLISGLTTFLLLATGSFSSLTGSLVWLGVVSVAGLLIPSVIAQYFRYRYPIETASFVERNPALSILMLTLFIIVSFQTVELKSFWPYGVSAIVCAGLLRALAFGLARRDSIYAVDDYITMSYPNIFFVIALVSNIGAVELQAYATWFLVPMFALMPIDEWLALRLVVRRTDRRLYDFLKIEHKQPSIKNLSQPTQDPKLVQNDTPRE